MEKSSTVIEVCKNRPNFVKLFNEFIKSYKYYDIYDMYDNIYGMYDYLYGLGSYYGDDDEDDYYLEDELKDSKYSQYSSHNESDDFVDYGNKNEDDNFGGGDKKKVKRHQKRHHSSKRYKKSNESSIEIGGENLVIDSKGNIGEDGLDRLIGKKRKIHFYKDYKLPLSSKEFKSFKSFYNHILDLGEDLDDSVTAKILRMDECHCCFSPLDSSKLIVSESYGSLYWDCSEGVGENILDESYSELL